MDHMIFLLLEIEQFLIVLTWDRVEAHLRSVIRAKRMLHPATTFSGWPCTTAGTARTWTISPVLVHYYQLDQEQWKGMDLHSPYRSCSTGTHCARFEGTGFFRGRLGEMQRGHASRYYELVVSQTQSDGV